MLVIMKGLKVFSDSEQLTSTSDRAIAFTCSMDMIVIGYKAQHM